MAATINLRELPPDGGFAAKVEATFQGFSTKGDIEITFMETDQEDSLIPNKRTQRIGKITGSMAVLEAVPNLPPKLTMIVKKSEPAPTSKLKIRFVFPLPDGNNPGTADFDLPVDAADAFEGDQWEIVAIANDATGTESPTLRVTRIKRALSVQRGEATYSFYSGHDIKLYNDGSTDAAGSAGYYRDLRAAIDQAEHFIFIADWSFHPSMRLTHSGRYTAADTTAAQLISRAKKLPDLLVAVHAWDHTGVDASLVGLGILGAFDSLNDDGNGEFDRLANVVFGDSARPKNILWKRSSRTGIGFSHHQKFAVMDTPVRNGRRGVLVFMGGLDVTKGRWDFGDHPIMESDPAGATFTEKLGYTRFGVKLRDDWYNNELVPLADVTVSPTLPRQPWHDVAVQVFGPTAWDVVREFVGRWNLDPSSFPAGGDTGSDAKKAVNDKFLSLFDSVVDKSKPHDPKTNPRLFAQQWEPAFGAWSAQLLRSMPRNHWALPTPIKTPGPDGTRNEFTWTAASNNEASILTSYLNAIRQAERFVYIETQYFISSGPLWGRDTVANEIARTLALHAARRASEGAPFHIYLVVPMFPEGPPDDSVNCAQRQFQWNTFRSMAKLIEDQTKRPWEERLSIFFLANWHDKGGKLSVTGSRNANLAANQRYQIYVHSKFMNVDDRFMIIGSANLNERSLNGARDTEICVALWPNNDKDAATGISQAQGLRRRLWQEHLRAKFPAAGANPESKACIDAVRAAAAENYKNFREGKLSGDSGHLCLWPIDISDTGFPVKSISGAPELDGLIPDRPSGLPDEDHIRKWRWHAPGKHTKPIIGDVTKPGQDLAE